MYDEPHQISAEHQGPWASSFNSGSYACLIMLMLVIIYLITGPKYTRDGNYHRPVGGIFFVGPVDILSGLVLFPITSIQI